MSTDAKATVFLVDDDPTSQDALRFLLDSMQTPLQAYASSEEFLNSYKGQPGCLVTDFRMPGMNGLELVEELINRDQELPFLLVTAHARTSVVVEAMRRGAVSVLDKPWNDDELWQAIRQAFAIDSQKRESQLHTAATRQKLATLTQKEQEVLELVLAGKPNKLMADRLGVSLRTIENRRRSVFQKIGVGTVAELVTVVLSSRQNETPQNWSDVVGCNGNGNANGNGNGNGNGCHAPDAHAAQPVSC